MKLNELGFDFSNAGTFVMKRKKFTFSLISLLMVFIFSFLFLTFLILYLLKVPIDSNGETLYYTDPEYQNVFIVIFFVMGPLFLISWVFFVISLFIKSKPFIIKNVDINSEVYYYIFDRKREIYLQDKNMIVYDKITEKAYQETNPDRIDEMHDKYIFWNAFNNLSDYKIKSSNKKTVLKFTSRIKGTVYRNIYKFYGKSDILPDKIVEIVNRIRYGNHRTEKYNTYLIESVNRIPEFKIPKQVSDILYNY